VTVSEPRALFLARGSLSVGFYRCALPATTLGCDWVGVLGEPGSLRFTTGRVPATFTERDIAGYDVVILQQVSGRRWLRAINAWQAAGVSVLYEIDDWMHGVRKLAGHQHRAHFDRATIEAHELCMRAADGVVCSTEWLARRYRSINPRTFTCRNGLDLARYAYTRPPREHVGIGWAGGTGHAGAVRPWMDGVREVMRRHPRTRFTSVGQPFASWLQEEFPTRALSIPFAALEVYPAAMTHFDVVLAPAAPNDFFRAKSDLRWLEAAALSLPCIADPVVYPEIEHGVTGFHASTSGEMAAILEELVADAALRERVGAAAHAHLREHRSAPVAAAAWASVLREVAGERTAAGTAA
jgi:glycosyltransferase involved in cell wall biosynthesis